MKKTKKKQKMNIKKVFATMSILVVLLLVGVLVYASSIKEDSVMNPMRVSNLEGQIEEEFQPDLPLKPSVEYPKKVMVKNEGNQNFFTRVMILPEITNESGVSLPAEIGKEILLDIDKKKWADGGDGYYYYLNKVLPDKASALLFTKVTLAKDIPATYKDAKLSIQLKSETVTSTAFLYRQTFWDLSSNQSPQTPALLAIDQKLATLIDQKE